MPQYDTQIQAVYAALQAAKTLDQKYLVIMKSTKYKHLKKFRVFGETYSWK